MGVADYCFLDVNFAINTPAPRPTSNATMVPAMMNNGLMDGAGAAFAVVCTCVDG